jgi:predicted ArsR family transcriptional regulator
MYEWVVAQNRPVGREEAARATGIKRPLAAFHLDRLVDAGLLEAAYERLTGRTGPGAGRPARVYRRATHDIAVSLPPRHYELAADMFADALQRIGNGGPPPELIDAAHDAGRIVAAGALDRVAGTPLPGKALTSVLAEAGYEPVMDEKTVRLRNCPFDALVEDHRPLVCGTNLALAEGILEGLPGEEGTEYQAAIDSQPGYCCVVFSSARSGGLSPED